MPISINSLSQTHQLKAVTKRLKRRMAYEVVIDDGAQTMRIGWKGRLFGKHRAGKICSFLRKRGCDARVRIFGQIVMPDIPRLFD